MIKIDKQLVENFSRGDAKAAEILFEQLRRPLFACLYRLACDRSIAEDLLQETLLTIHSRIETYNVCFDFMPWVWAITRNKFLEFKRSQNRVTRLMPHLVRACGPAGCFSKTVDFGADLRSCLDTLSEQTREAFVFKHFQGMTFQEIAELQQVPLATAKSRVLFALKKIREYFNRGEK